MTQALQQPNPAIVPAKITLDQYHRMVEVGIWEDCRVELLNGVVVEMSPEGTPHAHRSTTAGEYLRGILGTQVQIREGHPITIPASGSEPEPDIAIVQRLGEEYALHHPYPENIFWIIEYSNTTLKKDLEVKSRVYAAAGIVEYWVVNLQKNELVVMRDISDGMYQSQTILTTGTIESLAFPEVAIEISQILV
ncbi:MAG: Uma2 family endonuclease [Oculatellaceae cyanobacterium Prado106]|jgi:Uma2 family endonuclease|nr:Uma2 family endonuclease [Oculatellaceae cyanobacterium Prado106]